eukprot:CAMPEP_0116898912 /NCGR_PEP_ID=MMETSP0467-20121206/7561_1 /TAXON_ID=283647 /ORGANISM="Mesodinium pulex, Strain SPMC105" /LENGTH=56 /DNA_ID=CAMNT_0004571367 /DNA_START=70 /DNA_END=240 /DNA_ORIENTATION=-
MEETNGTLDAYHTKLLKSYEKVLAHMQGYDDYDNKFGYPNEIELPDTNLNAPLDFE